MTHASALLGLLLLLAQAAPAPSPSSPLVEAWRARGAYLDWQSTLPENAARRVRVFHACVGDAEKPVLVLVHGFPTSSFDFRLLAQDLQADYRLCTLDFPGYGLSDKPAGYRYTLADDAALLWRYVTEVLSLREFAIVSHDRGDSVTLNFLQLYQAAAAPPFRLTHLFLTNGNLFLPLANLTEFQKRMLDPSTSAAAVKAASAATLAAGLGRTQYTPPLTPGHPEVDALAALFAHQSGVDVIPATIQYLNERRQKEVAFLETLAQSAVPVTLMWGAHDTVAPLRVADHVFSAALRARKAPGAFWLMPCGNHYVLHDQPAEIAAVVRLTLAAQARGAAPPAAPLNVTGDRCGPVLLAREQAQ